jgi:hypothetical protein
VTRRRNLGSHGLTTVRPSREGVERHIMVVAFSHMRSIADGPGSLVEQGCKDQVLLNVAEILPDVLSHVHIVRDNEAAGLKVEDCSSGDEEGPSDEEMEF